MSLDSTHKCILVDGGWSHWGDWSSRSAIYGDGSRARSVYQPKTSIRKKQMCLHLTLTPPCLVSLIDFLVDGVWSSWNDWSSCSVSCGDGNLTRRRACDNPPSDHGGRICNGQSKQNKQCNIDNCPGNVCTLLLNKEA